MENKKYTVMIDSLGLTTFGEAVESNDPNIVKVKNPVRLIIQQDQQGRMQVQTIPIFFKDFAGKTEDIVWNFNKAQYTFPDSDIALDNRLIEQYNRINSPLVVPPASNIITPGGPSNEQSNPPTIKLFE